MHWKLVSMTNSRKADALARQVDIRCSGCLDAMEITLYAFDHCQWDKTSTKLILILSQEEDFMCISLFAEKLPYLSVQTYVKISSFPVI